MFNKITESGLAANNIHPETAPQYTGELVLRLVRGYLLPYKIKLIGAMVCMVIAAASQPLLAWLMEPVVRDIFINKDETMLLLVPLAIMPVSYTHLTLPPICSV